MAQTRGEGCTWRLSTRPATEIGLVIKAANNQAINILSKAARREASKGARRALNGCRIPAQISNKSKIERWLVI